MPLHAVLNRRVLLAGVATAIAVILLALDEAEPHRRGNPPPPRSTAVHAVEPSRRLLIGRSVHRRPIYAIELGSARAFRTILVVGCIHGNETAGIAIAHRLEAEGAPPGSAVSIVANLNPDGAAARTRQNADGVDLNRNFPWHWRPLGAAGDLQYSGPRPLSEPEARIAYHLMLRVRPRITIWFHQPEALVDLSGGKTAIERKFAKLVRLPTGRLMRYPGSAINWENARFPGTTAFAVELPPGGLSQAAIARYAHAVLTLVEPVTQQRQISS